MSRSIERSFDNAHVASSSHDNLPHHPKILVYPVAILLAGQPAVDSKVRDCRCGLTNRFIDIMMPGLASSAVTRREPATTVRIVAQQTTCKRRQESDSLTGLHNEQEWRRLVVVLEESTTAIRIGGDPMALNLLQPTIALIGLLALPLAVLAAGSDSGALRIPVRHPYLMVTTEEIETARARAVTNRP